VFAELIGSALPAGNYAAKCTRTPTKAKDGASVKILLAGITNFYDSDSSAAAASAAFRLRARTINHASPPARYAR
jgi:hypothetical protein